MMATLSRGVIIRFRVNGDHCLADKWQADNTAVTPPVVVDGQQDRGSRERNCSTLDGRAICPLCLTDPEKAKLGDQWIQNTYHEPTCGHQSPTVVTLRSQPPNVSI